MLQRILSIVMHEKGLRHLLLNVCLVVRITSNHDCGKICLPALCILETGHLVVHVLE